MTRPSSAECSNALFQYDILRSAWTELSAYSEGVPPSPRTQLGFAEYGGSLYVFGGKDNENSVLQDTFRFDIATMVWTELTTLVRGFTPPPRADHCFISALDALFVWGSFDLNGK